ncbi:zinc-binding metallopeptidase family protein [Paraburkholderia sp. RL17-337-BIB-A]|uniref:hypothetical protein n=1 Tax=Paraburkholderia sp. RL17-337-BIB-A TaxID=3031636 RepID=UPI0038BA49D8
MLTAHVPDLAAALERHVKVLAEDIGERNVFRPDALHAAADYIVQQWTRSGRTVTHQDYQVRGVPCANIEVALEGSVQSDEIIVLARITTPCETALAPMTTPAASPRSSRSRACFSPSRLGTPGAAFRS